MYIIRITYLIRMPTMISIPWQKKIIMTFKNFQAEQNPGFPSAASYSHRMGLHPSSMAMTADQFSLSSAAQVIFFCWQGWQNAWQGRVNYNAMVFVARWNHIENFPLLQAASRMYFNSQFFNHSGMGGVMGGHTVSISISTSFIASVLSEHQHDSIGTMRASESASSPS